MQKCAKNAKKEKIKTKILVKKQNKKDLQIKFKKNSKNNQKIIIKTIKK